MTSDPLVIDGCSIRVLGVIKGLVSESKKVQEAFDGFRPDRVAVSLSKENVDGLRNIPEDYEPLLTDYEEFYARGLERFGEVRAPPPCYVAVVEMADHLSIPLTAIDFDEDEYSALYCAAVSGTNLFRHSTRKWIVKRRKYSTKSPEDFVKAWDRSINGIEGFRIVEQRRAEHMAKEILRECKASKRLLAVIELERAGDVEKLLQSKGQPRRESEKNG
jgi:pheromone shutdown protein TraB